VSGWLGGLALATTGLFAGAALYVTLVEHPARMACGPMMAVAQFRRSYPRGAALQAPLAILAGLAGAGAWLAGAGNAWLAAGALQALLVPYTLLVIMPVTHRLLDPALEPDTPEAVRLLHRWASLHLVRTLASLVALGLMLRLR
jgi:hypothetical protein